MSWQFTSSSPGANGGGPAGTVPPTNGNAPGQGSAPGFGGRPQWTCDDVHTGGGGSGVDDTPRSNGQGVGPTARQGDRLIHEVERIELTSDKDIHRLARAINRLGRELHFILAMRAEEIQGVLSTYKGRWYTFGAASKVKARLVAAHLKVSAEAAKALGVGALKMSHAFQRHFVQPEQEAKQRAKGQKRRTFTIGDL